VLRRHAQLLADAGVDVLIFDTTNAQTFRENYLALCKVFSEIRKAGGRTPKIAFMVNPRAGETASEIYRDLYAKNLCPELWFYWRGRPLMICDPRRPEQVNVSVAQNLNADNGQVENMSSGHARGRSFHHGRQNITPGSVRIGANFQEQWQRALQV
jgi:hypothetical protein